MHNRFKILVVSLFLFITGFFISFSQSTLNISEYIELYKNCALEQERIYGIPASITLAQGILESGAGTSVLTKETNNHFGIKAFGGWNGPTFLAWDDEPNKSAFRVYASAEESYRDHSLFLINNERYASLFTKSVYDYRSWAIGLQKSGYASASNYARVLIGYIDTYKLYNINGGVKLRAGKTVIIKKTKKNEVPVFDETCKMDDSEKSQEELVVNQILKRYIVEINNVHCTILLPGERLASVALKYNISKLDLLKYNELSDDTDIKEGDIVFLERKKKKYSGPRDFHYVKEGDTMYSISQKYGVRLSALVKLNNKTFFSDLFKGEKILLK